MANQLLERKLRFSDVAYAIDSPPKALRNWLQRRQVALFSDDLSDGWREFSFADIAVLALVRKMVDFGVPVETANGLAHNAVAMFQIDRFKNMPPTVLATIWHNRTLVAWPTGSNSWALNSFGNWQDPRDIAAALTAEGQTTPASAYLSIDVEAVLRTAFERAQESVSVGEAQ